MTAEPVDAHRNEPLLATRRRQWLRAAPLERWYRLEPDAAPETDPEHPLAESEHNRALQDAVEQLPRHQREVLHLAFYQDLAVEDSAQMLAISLGDGAHALRTRQAEAARSAGKGGERS